MKKTTLAIIFFVLAIFLTALASAQYSREAPNIKVSITSQDPDPIEPGKQVEVSFKIDNEGALARGLVFEVMPEYPFSLLPGESPTKDIGILGNTASSERSVTVKFKLRVDQNAVDGNHELKVRYKSDESQSWIVVENLMVKIRAFEAILAVDKFTTEPSVVPPGAKTKLTITLRNYATSALKDIRLSLELGKSGDTVTPFSPLGSTNEKVISLIEPQSTKLVEFEILADPDALSKSYKIPFNIKYSDLSNKNYSKSNIVTVIVGDEPKMSVGIDSTTVYGPGTSGVVSVKIVNRGLPDMKFVNVRLAASDKYSVLSPSEIYIGNIDSDDYETADFNLFVEDTSEKKLTIPLMVEYKDANNKDYKSTVNLELALYSQSEAKKLGLVQRGSSFSWVVILVILVAAFFGYRMWKKRKKH